MIKAKKYVSVMMIVVLSITSMIMIAKNVEAQQIIADQESTIKEQKKQIHEQHRKLQGQNTETGEGSKHVENKEETLRSLGMFEITAYCPCTLCSSSWNRTTATGTTAIAGRTIGVNPDVIPYGSRIMINGHEYVAEDTGGAMRENPRVIDVFMESHEEALQFGRQNFEVFIIEP
jgi:3D (Asp-Asp-Asp) domain-containing protein